MQDDIDMEPLHKLFIYRKKLVKPYIERLLKWMDGITYMMSALFILTLVYEHGFLISFEEMEMINTLYHFVWIVFLVDISLHLLLNYSDIWGIKRSDLFVAHANDVKRLAIQ